MGDRRGVSVSFDQETFRRLRMLQKQCGFRSVGGMLSAMARLWLDRAEAFGRRDYGLTESDASYIDAMFDELGNAEREPGNRKRLK